MSSITFSVLPPPEILLRDVECIRVATHVGLDDGLEVKVCPNGLPGIVFGLSKDGSAAIESITVQSFTITDLPVLFLHGQGSAPSIMRFKKGPYTTIQVVLKPHALYSLFGMDASRFDQGFMVPEQFGMSGLTEGVLAAPSDAQRITVLCKALAGQLSQHPRDDLIEASLELIQGNIALASVRDVIEKLHISERQFQKRFARVVG